ncbi:adenine phosphoribosyltransferase [Flavobacterium fontis]|uniref:Adenine phosphoribosyltransferase n=1 Tax=Flavobacterium fontis TaxID=1124188 RepID=A0A1M5DLS4_9FLAO|nr:adenine phosphoribosyltransferase [Flavobacterium fontis]SHF67722.1 adenine phosphoribosyltransferase [Flavobacterium fontis]
MNLENYIRDIQDFPKPGIVFKDITPLLLSPEGRNQCLQQLVAAGAKHPIDKVVGVESRGFFFGTLVADRLQAGFVPVRKPRKLPFQTLSESYALEYGTDSLEIHADAIQPGDRVLIHDDVLATGGTAAAVCRLVERLGGEVVLCSFLMELTFLNGRQQLDNRPIHAVMTY